MPSQRFPICARAATRRRMRMRRDSRTKGGLRLWPPGEPPRRWQHWPLLLPGRLKGATVKVICLSSQLSWVRVRSPVMGGPFGQRVASRGVDCGGVVSTAHLSQGTLASLHSAACCTRGFRWREEVVTRHGWFLWQGPKKSSGYFSDESGEE